MLYVKDWPPKRLKLKKKKIQSKDIQFDLPSSFTALMYRKRGKWLILLLEKMFYQRYK